MKKLSLLVIAMFSFAMLFTSCEKEEDETTQDEFVLINEDINTATIWTSNNLYVVEGDIIVDANLTIQPGTIIKFKTGASIKFGWSQNATITANGTAENRIVFTSYSAMPTPGAWEGLFFYNNILENSSLTYCDIDYAGSSNWEAIGVYCKLTFSNNRVRYAKSLGIGLDYDGSFVAMNGNLIENCGTNALALYPESIHTLGVNNTINCNTGYGIFVLSGGDLTSSHGASLTWKKQSVPYIFDGMVLVETNLTIQPGTVLMFNANAYMRFGFSATNTVTAIGTATEPIIFTSSNLTPAAGAWYGIEVYDNTNSNSIFEYCQFIFAGKGNYDYRSAFFVYMVNGLTVKNCSFSNSAGYGIYLDRSSLSASSTGNTFSNCSLGNTGIYND